MYSKLTGAPSPVLTLDAGSIPTLYYLNVTQKKKKRNKKKNTKKNNTYGRDSALSKRLHDINTWRNIYRYKNAALTFSSAPVQILLFFFRYLLRKTTDTSVVG